MRAAWYERTGPAGDVLVVGDRPDPVPAAGEVRVRLVAAAVNRRDVKRRAGTGDRVMTDPLVIPGDDGAGVIDEVGAGVPAGRVGEHNGLNLDEFGAPVYDAVFAHIASARRGEFNRRYGQPGLTHPLTPGYGPPYDTTALLARQRSLGGVLPRSVALDPDATGWPLALGEALVALVSAVDDTGNEVAGIRLPALAAGTAAFTGWNPREHVEGLPDVLYEMVGSRLPGPAGEPDSGAVRAAAEALAADRFLLRADLDRAVAEALASG